MGYPTRVAWDVKKTLGQREAKAKRTEHTPPPPSCCQQQGAKVRNAEYQQCIKRSRLAGDYHRMKAEHGHCDDCLRTHQLPNHDWGR